MDTERCTETHTQQRDPAIVMHPHKLGAMHQNRISFVRSLIRRMANQNWQVSKVCWDISALGFGVAMYRLQTPSNHYHLVVFSNAITDEERNDRVIAEKWDVTFALVQGDVDNALLTQLRDNVPLQEAGRNNSQVLVLARANKSLRVFDHLLSCLAAGKQPDLEILADVGYILRTTAVYGNGKFGIADFELLKNNPDFNLSFSAQMCAVYLLRQFSLDWIHFLARQQGGDQATQLTRPLQRYLGVGNATGLGMAPYLIRHPRVVDQWLSARENAVTAVATNPITNETCQQIAPLLRRAITHLQQINTIDPHQQTLNATAISELEQLLTQLPLAEQQYGEWQHLLRHCQSMSQETQEILLACVLELYPQQVDHFENEMNSEESLTLAPNISVGDLIKLLEDRYRWALDIDFKQPANNYWFWYSSKDKEEPRMGIRGKESGEDKELPLDIARQAFFLHAALKTVPANEALSAFLLQQPQYRAIARRTWTLGQCEMGEIQMNVLDRDALPMNILRCKLAIFGATKFDPRSDRWVRVTFFQGAPLDDELHADEWLFPLLPDTPQQNSQPDHMMSVSHNELVGLCSKAFSGLRRHCGEADVIANMVADLEMVGLNGVTHFVKALDFIEHDRDTPADIKQLSKQLLSVNLHGCSILCHLPSLLDCTLDKLTDQTQISLNIEQCHNRWLAFGELAKLVAGKGLSIKALWCDSNNSEQIMYILNAGQVLPELYLNNQPDDAQPINPQALSIMISKQPFALPTPSQQHQHISSTTLTAAKQHAWKHGIKVNTAAWQTIKHAAKAILVESSASSLLGAGERPS